MSKNIKEIVLEALDATKKWMGSIQTTLESKVEAKAGYIKQTTLESKVEAKACDIKQRFLDRKLNSNACIVTKEITEILFDEINLFLIRLDKLQSSIEAQYRIDEMVRLRNLPKNSLENVCAGLPVYVSGMN